MALSPPYSERVKLPHQPAPSLGKGFHWPVETVEVYGHPWQRLFQCPQCRKGWEFKKDEMGKALGLFCHGDGTVDIYGED